MYQEQRLLAGAPTWVCGRMCSHLPAVVPMGWGVARDLHFPLFTRLYFLIFLHLFYLYSFSLFLKTYARQKEAYQSTQGR